MAISLALISVYCTVCGTVKALSAVPTETESKEKHGVPYYRVWDPVPELTVTSPYVDSSVGLNTWTMGNTMPDSALPLCQSRLYPLQSETLDLDSVYLPAGGGGWGRIQVVFEKASSSLLYLFPWFAVWNRGRALKKARWQTSSEMVFSFIWWTNHGFILNVQVRTETTYTTRLTRPSQKTAR